MPFHRRPVSLFALPGIVLGLVMSVVMSLAGCSARPAPVMVTGDEAFFMIEQDANVRVVDVRSPEDAAKGGIVGARHLDVPAWYDRLDVAETGFDHPETWAAEFEKLAIGPDTRVLIVDAGNPERPGRGAGIWFMMQRLGFDNASFVAGGYPAIANARATISRGSPVLTRDAAEPAEPGETRKLNGPAFVPTGRAVYGGSPGKDEVRGLVGSHEVKLVDARSLDEFTGVRVYEGNPRGGHIPGAVLITHRDVFGPDAGFRPREEIRARLKAAGLNPDDTIVTYCQGGGRSAALAAAMIYAGYEHAANYFGSFSEWSNDESCPVETGPSAAGAVSP